MYRYEYAIVKLRAPDARYERMDVSQVPVQDLAHDYREVYLVLSHPLLPTLHTLLLSSTPPSLLPLLYTTTVTQWLEGLDNAALPTTEGEPQVDTRSALVRDIWQAGYKADLAVPVGSPYNDAVDADKTDIWLTRPETDYVDVQRHCLATVNGLIHRLDGDVNGLYVKDGGIAFFRSGTAHLSLISFKGLGRLRTYSITPDMVYSTTQNMAYRDKLSIKLPFDASDKVVGIVIGGYLHLGSNDVRLIGPHSLQVDIGAMPVLDRYMTDRHSIDLSSMERFHQFDPTLPGEYDYQAFFSNESLVELMTLSQSFIVALDVDHLSTTLTPLTRTHLPGRFYHDEHPHHPLRTALGSLPSYLTEEEKGIWVLRVQHSLQHQRFFNTYDPQHHSKVNDIRLTHQPQVLSRGDLVKWSTHHLTIK